MRRKPSGQGNYGNNNSGGSNNNNQQRKQRFQGGGGGNGGGNGGGYGQNRPRKNYAAAREKYLSQARDALAQGDRVLAENYFQHADHCYRMMVEEGYNTRNNNNQQHNQNGDQQNDQGGDQSSDNAGNQHNDAPPRDDHQHASVTQLPAFLTGSIEDDRKSEHVAPQNWEEN